MKTQLYAIYDTAAGIYSKPIFARADGEVMREFQQLCKKEDHPYCQNPQDFSLWRLGVFNDQNGDLTDEANECLAKAIEVKALHENQKLNQAPLDLVDISPGGTS